MGQGKLILDAYKQVDNSKFYSVSEAVEILLKNKRTRFGKYKTSTYKKAYIKLAEGKEINMENPFK